jgi:Ca-activated chloride channel family protein
MKSKSIVLLMGIFSTPITLLAQQADQLIQAGNELYKQQKYDQAETQYNNAVKKEPGNTTAKYNLANAMYRTGKQEEAIKKFDELTISEEEAAEKSKAFYNKGAILSSQKKLEESIEAYKNALRQNPDDKEARENLQKALLELKKKNPPKKKEDEPKKKKEQQQQQKKQSQPKMSRKESEQRLKLLQQKEKEVQQRLQKEKAKTGGGQAKDW